MIGWEFYHILVSLDSKASEDHYVLPSTAPEDPQLRSQFHEWQTDAMIGQAGAQAKSWSKHMVFFTSDFDINCFYPLRWRSVLIIGSLGHTGFGDFCVVNKLTMADFQT